MTKVLESKEDVYLMLQELGANKRLITHLKLVGEAADMLIEKFKELSVPIDEKYIELGVAIHDVGKIKHTSELDNPGNNHEPEGEKMMLASGVAPKIARCCMSHARFKAMEVTIEELLVALYDKLWKGQRESELELMVAERAAEAIGKERWDIFIDLDSTFEEIAAGRVERLNRRIKDNQAHHSYLYDLRLLLDLRFSSLRPIKIDAIQRVDAQKIAFKGDTGKNIEDVSTGNVEEYKKILDDELGLGED